MHYFDEKVKFSRGNLGVPFESDLDLGRPGGESAGKVEGGKSSLGPAPSNALSGDTSSSESVGEEEQGKSEKGRNSGQGKKRRKRRAKGSYVDHSGQSIPQKGVAIF